MSRSMRVAVLGAGSWGTTVASLAAANTSTVIWARREDVAEQINRVHRNERYLAGLPLHPQLRATASLAEALQDCDVVVMGVPSHSLRQTLRDSAEHVRPW
ncbi:MAG: NAD(P)-binding domain-containing protein, partial [Comamonadaceae bacterium]|nr:NAD(P)-binding domain-containing protein [Comamonadaceae bacterium]